ncbi:MAG: hypothetical protein ACXWCY_03320 [Burkholderiales bacterium]
MTILETVRDRDALEKAAVALASSGDPQSLARLGEFLRRADFLARLDDLATPAFKTSHLRRVFDALAKHPNGATEQLCLLLASDPVFLDDDDRRIYLLPALAAVTPMSETAAEVFRRANAEGYYSTSAPLLMQNGSPHALALFEEMIRDRTVPIARRNDALHVSIVPRRTNVAVLDAARRLLDGPLEKEVAAGVIESIFDDQSRRWFGPSGSAPRAPAWEGAPTAALHQVLAVAAQVRGRKLAPELAAAVKRTTNTVQRILANER